MIPQTTTSKRGYYLDVNSRLGIDARPELVADIEAINNSLYNLFNCNIGGRRWERRYGCDVLQSLFEPNDTFTHQKVAVGLLYAIDAWEPRIQVTLRDVSVLKMSVGFAITVGYKIKKVNIVSKFEFVVRDV